MNQNNEIKFNKSLKNLNMAMKSLGEYLKKPNYSDLERAGIVQNFEIVFELFWKTIQKKGDVQGRGVGGARDAFVLAFEWGLIPDEKLWFNMIQDRNLTVHTYNQDLAMEIIERLKNKYFPAFQGLLEALKKANPEEETDS